MIDSPRRTFEEVRSRNIVGEARFVDAFYPALLEAFSMLVQATV